MAVAREDPRKITVQGSIAVKLIPRTTSTMEDSRSKNSSPTSSVILPAAV